MYPILGRSSILGGMTSEHGRTFFSSFFHLKNSIDKGRNSPEMSGLLNVLEIFLKICIYILIIKQSIYFFFIYRYVCVFICIKQGTTSLISFYEIIPVRIQ